MKPAEAFRIGYHNWFLVAFYIVLVGVFIFGVLRPRRRSEWRSAKTEEADALAQFGDEYRRYQGTSGMFWPSLRT